MWRGDGWSSAFEGDFCWLRMLKKKSTVIEHQTITQTITSIRRDTLEILRGSKICLCETIFSI